MNDIIEQRIHHLQEELKEKQRKLKELKRQREPKVINDYTFTNKAGEEVTLTQLFGNKTELLIIHNMGKGCPYCTLWADGFNGFAQHLSNRVNWALVSPDEVEDMKAFAESRNWTYPVLSSKGNTFKLDMGFETDDGKVLPGYSVFTKLPDGTILHTNWDTFGPGDSYAPIWHIMDLLPDAVNGWVPKFEY